jgi:hypothetical protein
MNNITPSKNYRRWLGGALLLAAPAALVWAVYPAVAYTQLTRPPTERG